MLREPWLDVVLGCSSYACRVVDQDAALFVVLLMLDGGWGRWMMVGGSPVESRPAFGLPRWEIRTYVLAFYNVEMLRVRRDSLWLLKIARCFWFKHLSRQRTGHQGQMFQNYGHTGAIFSGRPPVGCCRHSDFDVFDDRM